MNLHVLELADKGAKEYGLAACKTENRAKKKWFKIKTIYLLQF